MRPTARDALKFLIFCGSPVGNPGCHGAVVNAAKKKPLSAVIGRPAPLPRSRPSPARGRGAGGEGIAFLTNHYGSRPTRTSSPPPALCRGNGCLATSENRVLRCHQFRRHEQHSSATENGTVKTSETAKAASAKSAGIRDNPQSAPAQRAAAHRDAQHAQKAAQKEHESKTDHALSYTNGSFQLAVKV